MKMRTGLVAGAAIGYYFGSKAGRQRYDQLAKLTKQARKAGSITARVGKAKAIAELSVERARDVIGLAKEQYDERGDKLANDKGAKLASVPPSNDSLRARVNGNGARSYL